MLTADLLLGLHKVEFKDETIVERRVHSLSDEEIEIAKKERRTKTRKTEPKVWSESEKEYRRKYAQKYYQTKIKPKRAKANEAKTLPARSD